MRVLEISVRSSRIGAVLIGHCKAMHFLNNLIYVGYVDTAITQ